VPHDPWSARESAMNTARLKAPLAAVGRVHDRDGDQKLHDTLQRESFVSIDTRDARRVLNTDSDPPVESPRRIFHLLLEIGVLKGPSGNQRARDCQST
jgi:hypothetical protein